MNFRGIDLNVDFAGPGGVGAQVAGYPVIEAHAESQQQVGLLDGVVAVGFAVHAHHAQAEGVGGRETAQT